MLIEYGREENYASKKYSLDLRTSGAVVVLFVLLATTKSQKQHPSAFQCKTLKTSCCIEIKNYLSVTIHATDSVKVICKSCSGSGTCS